VTWNYLDSFHHIILSLCFYFISFYLSLLWVWYTKENSGLLLEFQLLPLCGWFLAYNLYKWPLCYATDFLSNFQRSNCAEKSKFPTHSTYTSTFTHNSCKNSLSPYIPTLPSSPIPKKDFRTCSMENHCLLWVCITIFRLLKTWHQFGLPFLSLTGLSYTALSSQPLSHILCGFSLFHFQ
jgi:hypothetical protein